MGNSTVTELMDFTGGMNTLVAPHLISKGESTALVNVDVRLGSLASMPNLERKEELQGGGFFYEFMRDVYSYSSYRDNVTWDNKWYWTTGTETKKMLADGTEMGLGLATPTGACDVNEVASVEGPHTGDFKYAYTFYSDQTNVESAPSPLQNQYTTVESAQLELTNFDALPADATHYRIYRIGGYLPVFTLVDTITDTETPYIDDIGDTQVDGRQLTTMYCGMPPNGLINLVEFNGRFYGSVGNRVYYSAMGNPDAWYISDYFLARETIIGLATSPGGILILGRNFTMMMYGTQPTDYKVKLLSDNLGCISRRSIAYLGDSAIWLSHRSFVMSNGYTITDITAHKIDNLRGILPSGAVVDDNVYYMQFKPFLVPLDTLYPSEKLYPSLIDGTAGLDEGIIAMDFKRGNGFSYKLISYDGMMAIGMIDGEVHVSTGAVADGTVDCEKLMFDKCLDFLPCSGFELSRLSVYNGQGLTRLHYISPRLADGSLATLKQYDKVRISYSGIFNIKVLFDAGEVVVERATAEVTELDKIIIIGIPNSNNISKYIRFVIEGVGVISSIQYSWKPRELVN